MAQRMAQMQAMQASGVQPGQGAMRPPQQAGQSGAQPGQNRMGQGGGMRGGSIDDMLDRFPNITIADLKVGEMIAVSSTKNAAMDNVTAIKLLSGVEPFLKSAQASAGGGRRGGQAGQDAGFSIPGLDGAGFP